MCGGIIRRGCLAELFKNNPEIVAVYVNNDFEWSTDYADIRIYASKDLNVTRVHDKLIMLYTDFRMTVDNKEDSVLFEGFRLLWRKESGYVRGC